ncbi:unnamed protein product [Rangifer tarandus platyrhynchus]|uniref:Uncharacterized protein n=1 Tax=Rangifer tarandus platyrhynchus TaxID=3082113 RepID=A0ABN8ZZF6_RANTA|nr:unnamed protein product [Rangifer tarandus platyrhynchus]
MLSPLGTLNVQRAYSVSAAERTAPAQPTQLAAFRLVFILTSLTSSSSIPPKSKAKYARVFEAALHTAEMYFKYIFVELILSYFRTMNVVSPDANKIVGTDCKEGADIL